MQLREDLKEGSHWLTQVLLDHLLSNAQADEGDEADGFHTQDSPGLGSTWEPGNKAHSGGLAQNPPKVLSERSYWSKQDKETEAQKEHVACSGLGSWDQNQDSWYPVQCHWTSPQASQSLTHIAPIAGLLPPGDGAGAYPVMREVRKLRTGSKTSWLIRGRMSMRVVSERYTMIFWVRVTAASSPASLRLFNRLGLEVLPGAT